MTFWPNGNDVLYLGSKEEIMNLAELVAVVAATTDMPQPQVRESVKQTLKTILMEVERGGRVTLVGFGAFFSSMRGRRVGRNPKTGETVDIPPCRVPVFKAGKEFKTMLKPVNKQTKKVEGKKKSKPKTTKSTKRTKR